MVVPADRSRRTTNRLILLLAFAFAVMADPVSSVAYAIEAALRALRGDLMLLLPMMALVVAIIVVVIVNYHQIVGGYPQGGGAAAAVADAFGEPSACCADRRLRSHNRHQLRGSRRRGHRVLAQPRGPTGPDCPAAARRGRGRCLAAIEAARVFAAMTVAFVVLIAVVLIAGLFLTPHPGPPPHIDPGHSPPLAVALACLVAMALATGVEAPSLAIAQLGQLDDVGRRRFGRITLWLTLAVVGTLTLGLTVDLVHLRIGVPPRDSTQIAELARVATAPPVFAAFQLATALLLLSAASSSFQAGPGLLKALARHRDSDGARTGILPAWLGRTNSRYTPYWGVVVFMLAAGAVTRGRARTRPGTRPVLRRGGVCRLPRGPGRHVSVFLAAAPVRLPGNQSGRRRCGQFHPCDQCRSRRAHYLHSRSRNHRLRTVCDVGAFRAPPRDPQRHC